MSGKNDSEGFTPEDAIFFEELNNQLIPQGAIKDLAEANQLLEKKCTELSLLNSSFPATREFLEQRGLRNVNELDKKGREDLVSYLKKLLD